MFCMAPADEGIVTGDDEREVICDHAPDAILDITSQIASVPRKSHPIPLSRIRRYIHNVSSHAPVGTMVPQTQESVMVRSQTSYAQTSAVL